MRQTLDQIDEPRIHLNKYVKVTGGGGKGLLVGLRKGEGCVQFPGEARGKTWYPLTKLAPDEVTNLVRHVNGNGSNVATPVRVDHHAAQVPIPTLVELLEEHKKAAPEPPPPKKALGTAIDDLVQLATEIKGAESDLAKMRQQRDEILARHQKELDDHDHYMTQAEASLAEYRKWAIEAKYSLSATLGI